MLYFTFGDAPSGVLSSQAIDVVKYLRTLTDKRIRFAAFISIRDFKKNKAKIKGELSDAIVLPMFPKIDSWQWNWITFTLLCLFTGERNIIARNVLAVHIALKVKRLGLVKKICLDGRGAIAAEWHEYNVMPSEKLRNQIADLENTAVTKTHFRIAVSQALVAYWNESYYYNSNQHIVIPCTLGFSFNEVKSESESEVESEGESVDYRTKLKLADDDIVLIYSGSVAGWQSFGLLEDFLAPHLSKNKKLKVVFMSGNDKKVETLINKFPQQVQQIWVAHNEVQHHLKCGDYGILLREQTVTNRVASPTKFAEYLAAGLSILISENLGDYTAFVEQHLCGKVITTATDFTFEKTTTHQQLENKKLVATHFTKASQKEKYMQLIDAMK